MIEGLKKFTNINRGSSISEAVSTTYDLVVVGGGVTGAGIALDASLRGLKVLLLEKKDFASGTSSKSTKLIHGGLRYLKQLEFGLVRETGLERSVAHNNACHLVHPENMFLPIVEGGSFSKLTASLAISVYDRLAKVPPSDRKKMLNKAVAANTEPLLREDILKSGIIYSEYRTDDARLTIEIIKAAKREGAEIFNYMAVVDFGGASSKARTVICSDLFTGDQTTFKTKCIVNAAGPWADGIRTMDHMDSDNNLRLSKGVHLVFDKEKIPIQNSIYFDAFDGRMIFAIPRGKVVYVGTTDTNYDNDLDRLTCTQDDVDYLLSAINKFFNLPALSVSDVQSSWVGLRPLIHQKGKPPTELSRKDEIFISETGMISIVGGKLTGYRKMAERVVDEVYKRLRLSHKACVTKNYEIHHNPFSDYEAFVTKVNTLFVKHQDELSQKTMKYLVSSYGNDVDHILNAAMNNLNPVSLEEKIVEAQLDYALQYESIAHPMDFIDRRAGWLFFDIGKGRKYLNKVLAKLSEELGYDRTRSDQFLEECKEEMDEVSLENLKQNLS